MKPVELISLSLLGSASIACGVTSTTATGPYENIAVRNLFALKVVQPAQIEQVTRPVPLVRMTGLTTIFGDKRVLLKIALPAQPPEPAQEITCILLEGQSIAGISVLEIDMRALRVRIANAGRESWLAFEKEPALAVTMPPVQRP